MQANDEMLDVLNDLVKVNNDRIAAYEKAITEAKDLDIDLKALFRQMVTQSEQYKTELCQAIEKSEGVVEDDTSSSGKIYRAWMDIKRAFTESDRLSILVSCEFTEDAAQRAYQAALTSNDLRDEEMHQLVNTQKGGLEKSHELVKKQRDAYKALKHE